MTYLTLFSSTRPFVHKEFFKFFIRKFGQLFDAKWVPPYLSLFCQIKPYYSLQKYPIIEIYSLYEFFNSRAIIFPCKLRIRHKKYSEKFCLVAKISNGHNSINIAQNTYYDLFSKMEQPFCICPCGRNLDPGTRISYLHCNTPAITKNSKKGELILNQWYPPHPQSNLTDFLFWNWIFFHKESISIIRFYRSYTKTSRSMPQTRCPKNLSTTPLIFRSKISPSSRLQFSRFCFWN